MSDRPPYNGPIRVSLNAQALRSLISEGSETFLEIDRLAANAVAEELRRKLVPEKITQAVESAFQGAIASVQHGSTYLTPEYRSALQKTAREAVQVALAELVQETVTKTLGAQVDVAVKRYMTDEVKASVDRAIRARMDSMLRR